MADGIRVGNIKLVVCFVFYLAWWVVAFNPTRPVRGPRSAWLVLVAAVFAVLAIADIAVSVRLGGGLLDGRVVLAAGIASYVALAVLTQRLAGRPVTSELLIIVSWVSVSVLEVSTLVGLGCVSASFGCALVGLCLAAGAACLVCYMLFYGLDVRAAFVDGAIPLLVAPALTGLIAWVA